MNKYRIVSLVVTSVLSLFLFFGLGGKIIPKEYLQFFKNLAQNDNHLNYANHEYGYNFMMSAEPNSIFMTEGGDNQVFSLLYFATAERRRPDIDFFDQKGNVFPRLYGDLLNTFPDELRLVREIRDYQLFSTDRPVYLTWKRPGLEKLNLANFQKLKREIVSKAHPARRPAIEQRFRLGNLEELKYTARNMVGKSIFDLQLRSGANLADQDFQYLGPWYFKRFGMVFKVTPIRYAIVDGLEMANGVSSFQNLRSFVEQQSKINLTEAQFNFYVSQLKREGYLDPNVPLPTVKLLKPYRVMADIDSVDYWKHYMFSHTNVYNASSWDFLTREIFGNYIRRENNNLNEKVVFYRNKANFSRNDEDRQRYQQLISETSQKALEVYGMSTNYNYDNPFMMYNYGKTLFTKSQQEQASRILAKSSEYDYKFVAGYLDAVRALLSVMQGTHPVEQVERWKSSAREYLAKFYDAKILLYSSTGKRADYDTDKDVVAARQLEKQINSVVPSQEPVQPAKTSQLKQPEIVAVEDSQAQKVRENVDRLKKLLPELESKKDHQKVISIHDQIIALEPNKFDNHTKKYEYTIRNGILNIAIQVIQNVLKNYQTLEGQKPPQWSLLYNLGRLYYDVGSQMVGRDQGDQGRQLLGESKKSLSAFIEQAKLFSNQGTIKNRIEDADKLIIKIDESLK